MTRLPFDTVNTAFGLESNSRDRGRAAEEHTSLPRPYLATPTAGQPW
ncbi:hypothetical protein AB0D14_01195 [Streptomyces sp. NPDC048484]